MIQSRNPQLGLLILRVTIGLIYFTHGWPKLIGGAVGPTGQFFGQLGIPLPGVMAWVITLLEFFGGLALIAGFLVPYLAGLFGIEMLVGIFTVHLPNGWYVIGPGQGGAEFNVLLIAGLLTLLLAGSGSPSVDERMRARRARGAGEPTGMPGV